jgi:phosphoglycerate dehydrogenase-like enzyme
MDPRLTVALAMRPASLAAHLFDPAARGRLAAVADVHPEVLEDFESPPARRVLAATDVLITGWGISKLTDDVMAAAPRLRAIVHTGGNASHLLGPAATRRGLILTNARLANSRPVAEYALAMILLAGKRVLRSARLYADRRDRIDREQAFPDAGNHGLVIGIVGASTTARLTVELLRPHDVHVLVYDPYLSDDEAHHLGVLKTDLDTLMTKCSVISIHAPETPETYRMIDAQRLALLPHGATLINTARGALIDTDALVAELGTGRIDAILDVTDPEPLPPHHPLWRSPNALLTPHVAGSMGNELPRLGECAVTEVERLAAGLPVVHPEYLRPETLLPAPQRREGQHAGQSAEQQVPSINQRRCRM